MRRATGAARAVLFDHTLRRITPESAKQAAGGAGIGVAAIGGWATAGVNRVHGDYTLAGAPRRVVGLSAPSASGSFAETRRRSRRPRRSGSWPGAGSRW